MGLEHKINLISSEGIESEVRPSFFSRIRKSVIGKIAAYSLAASLALGGVYGCGGSSGGGGDNGDPGPGPTPTYKYVFVTSTTTSGNLMGLDGADTKCNNIAEAAGLPRNYKAWLSDSDTDAINRINDVGPWHLMNGIKVFDNKASLATMPLNYIDINELGNLQSIGCGLCAVWTGTLIGGTRDIVNNCNNWTNTGFTGRYGTFVSDLNLWTDYTRTNCGEPLHLYCFEQ